MKGPLLQAVLIFLTIHRLQPLSYDPADYIEVYPDPRDPEVLRGRTPLHFALIMSLGGPLSQFDTSGSVAGVKVALDRINNDSSLLPGYTLHYTFTDSKCNRTEGLNALYSQLLHRPTKLAVIGSGCSVATEPTAEVSHFYNITQLSCASSSSELSNRVRYPNYFQLLSAEDRMALGFYGVIMEFQWRKVALLVQDENLFTVTMTRLKKMLDDADILYVEKTFDTNIGISDLGSNPFDLDGARIFLLAMYSVNARPLLCEAYRQGIQLPQYLLLTIGWYVRFWWRIESPGLDCTADERESVLPSSLAFIDSTFLNETSDVNLTTTTGIMGGEFLTEEQKFLGMPPLNATYYEYSQYCYDATWTLAYALNNTIHSLSESVVNDELSQTFNITPPFRLEDFTYSNHRVLKIIFRHLANTSFSGVTGPVIFGDQGVRTLKNLTIFQFRNRTNDTDGRVFLDWGTIGHIRPRNDSESGFIYAPGEDIETVWNGLDVYDGVPRNETVTVHIAVTVVYITLGSAGIIFALACLTFNFIFRDKKLVKLASYHLNYLIGIGAIVLYMDIILLVVPSTDPEVVTILCNLRPWLSAIGFSLCYGTILVKMARVYHIFNNPSPNKAVKDWILFLGVVGLIVIDITILSTYTLTEGLRGNLRVELIRNQENPSSFEGVTNIETDYYFYVCNSNGRSIFLGVLYGYKMILQGIALLLAFSIRKVKVKGLDDSKYIAAAIYVTTPVQAIVIVTTYSLVRALNGYVALLSTVLLLGTTAILFLVFVPLMKRLYKDPKGENIFKKSSGGDMTSSNNMGIKNSTDNDAIISTLRKRIKTLEDQMEEKNLKQNLQGEPNKRSESSKASSNMMTEEVHQKTTFSKTIWDQQEKDNTPINGDTEMENYTSTVV